MRHFADLFRRVDETTKTNEKVRALVDFFGVASDEDKLWAIGLFTHRRPRRTVKTALLRTWASEIANIPAWIFEESYHIVGDLAETIALVLPDGGRNEDKDLSYWIEYLIDLRGKDEAVIKDSIIQAWQSLPKEERFIFNKLITGGWRIGVSQKLITKALAQYLDVDDATIAHRLMGDWTPDKTTFQRLLLEDHASDQLSKPYPFYLAYAFDLEFDDLGTEEGWIAERKWDGIRGQLIKRSGELFLWSRGEELITDKFPEFNALLDIKADNFVLDGEIMPYKDGPLSFNQLQTRIGRKNVSKKILESTPVKLIAYDLLELDGIDLRHRSMAERRTLLEGLHREKLDESGVVLLSELVPFESWEDLVEERALSRSLKCEGLMLKKKDSPYQSGRKRGDWWKWKIDPMTIDAIMLYAQRGHGRRANLYTDYTFAVWDGEALVPFAKAYSGLTDKEFREITQWVKKNTKERFGPVASVHPVQVFEVAFEGINASKRHKSGLAVRFPRIHRWRKDKPASEAGTLEELKGLIED